MQAVADRWSEGDPYESYVGRWSRRVAPQFLQWLDVPEARDWVDVGCGTGALSASILQAASPRSVQGIDRSAGFLASARERIIDGRVRFHEADATALPLPDGTCDAAVSGLVLNFVPDPGRMVAEMVRVTRTGGCVAAYVWDYAQGMQMMRLFWDAAVAEVPEAAAADEARRFPVCTREGLQGEWRDAGLVDVAVRALAVPTVFADFDDYWTPFLGRQGAAPAWLASRPAEQQDAIRERLRDLVPRDAAGRIPLEARAWAVKGQVAP